MYQVQPYNNRQYRNRGDVYDNYQTGYNYNNNMNQRRHTFYNRNYNRRYNNGRPPHGASP